MALKVEILECPRCGHRAYLMVDDGQAVCTTCKMVWFVSKK